MDELAIKIIHLVEQKKTNKRSFSRMIGISHGTLYNFLNGLDVHALTKRKMEEGIRILEGTQSAENPKLIKKIQEEEGMEDRLIEKARFVLRSGTAEAAALHANIVAFFGSLTRSKDAGARMMVEDPQEKGPGGSS